MKTASFNRCVVGFVLGPLSVAAIGCSSGDAEAAKLPESVFASQIPIYPSARYESCMGGSYHGEIGGAVTARSRSWFFDTTDPVEKIIAFYSEKLPQAERSTDEDETHFELIPKDARPGEKVRVIIQPGRLQITETQSADRFPGEE